jgi:hypothetical protein
MNPTSREYAELMEVMGNHPNYTLDQRAIKKNPKKETYAGLTYEYMRDYIILHSTPEEEAAAVAEFDELILVSKCHRKAQRYPTIKKWFLEKYPEILEFGMPTIDVPVENKIKKLPTTQDQNLPKASGLS